MRRFLFASAALIALSSCRSAQQPSKSASLFDRLPGTWVLRGTIDKKDTVHDVVADLVLGGGYVRIHEVSREKDAKGAPAYEAILFISVDKKTGQYNCLWLDSTSNAALSSPVTVIGRGIPNGNAIPFLFKLGPASVLHTTFTYSPSADSWLWTIDDEEAGRTEPFARVTLTRQ